MSTVASTGNTSGNTSGTTSAKVPESPRPPRSAQATRASRARVLIAVMLFVTVVINYMDRANLSIAMPAIADELDLSTAQQGLLLSAFGWTYAALQIPGGWLVDRVSPRILYPILLVVWSLATVLMGIVGGFVALIALRLVVGVFEAPAYPINNRVATTWFPERERGSVIGFYTSGSATLRTPSTRPGICRSTRTGSRTDR